MKKYKQLSDENKESAEQLLDMLKTAVNYHQNTHEPVELKLDGLACEALHYYINNLQYERNTLLEALCMAKQKYNNDKARYRRKAKIYREQLKEVNNDKTNKKID